MTTEEKGEAGGRTGARQKMGDGIKQGIGVLSALKEALEETIQEARERGDLSTDRAKEVMKGGLGKAQAAASGARERLDFVSQGEHEALQATVASLRTRVAALEERVFGAGDPGREPGADGGGGTSAP
jgi:polyhydroxyalkanoate synthesis regulator phasin